MLLTEEKMPFILAAKLSKPYLGQAATSTVNDGRTGVSVHVPGGRAPPGRKERRLPVIDAIGIFPVPQDMKNPASVGFFISVVGIRTSNADKQNKPHVA